MSAFLVVTFFFGVAFLTADLLAAFFLGVAFFALVVTADLAVVAGFGEVTVLVVEVFATGVEAAGFATAFGFFEVRVFSDLDSALATSSACSSQKKFPDLNRIDPIRSARFPEEIDSFDCSLLIS